MEIRSLEVDGVEVEVEALVAAYKAETEREQLRKAREARAAKYGIGVKEGGRLTPPKGYPTTEADYGDPVNYQYPADAERALAAMQYFNHQGQREAGGYTSEEWGIIGKRLAGLVSKHLEATYEFKEGKLAKKKEDGKSFSLDERRRQVRDAWIATFAKRTGAPEVENVSYWVKEVFDDQVIVEAPDGLYSYPYTAGDDGEVEFGDPVKVEIAYRPVTSSEKALGDDLMIAFGDDIKAVDVDGQKARVGGYLVRFGKPDEPDLTDVDYFAADTYYGPTDGDGADTMVHHGIPLKAGLEGLAQRILAPIKTRRDEFGIWAETVLDLADQYERIVHEMVQAGKLKWSSGTAARLARREASGKISRWPIIEGSLTPTPMEPRLPAVMPLKTYLGMLEELEPGGGDAGASRLEVTKALARVTELLVEIEEV